ncbi:aldo-keto reductase AKR2E4-like isoform X2 [Leptidea sinapis]|uniref:aldo-keto reductase AKR2E4-like isoform X2 n=1 Tax=Leptidea sinapis TaxID=189913 RepID=UPI002125D5F7|nr:aldo-keto reductase AKR2E4-like isoform X2 [Leptidea sinapis]
MYECSKGSFHCRTKVGASGSEVPRIKLSNGAEMPAIALGAYLGFDENGIIRPREHNLRDVIVRAIDVGYRHFDTASIYETEAEVGQAVRLKIAEGAVHRHDIFITTKLWNTQHRRDQVVSSLKESLKKMGLSYVDLYLMHWPIGLNEDYSYSDADYMETWRGLEDAQWLGLTRSIGVSNFNQDQLQRVIAEGSIKPVALQIEIHPQLVQQELVDFAQRQGIVVMGYSPFGSLVKRFGVKLPGPQIDDSTLVEIAKKFNKTTPQVVLRWLVDRNIVPIAKTMSCKRLKENINIFDFQLNDADKTKINNFNENRRYTFPTFWQSHLYYPFEKVDNPSTVNPFMPKT